MTFSRVTWRFLWLVISCDTQPFYPRISLAHLSRLNALRSVLVYLADCLPDLVALFFALDPAAFCAGVKLSLTAFGK